MEEDELLEISEEMGEVVHNAWMEKRKKEKGWHNPDDCPNRPQPGDRDLPHLILEGKYCDNCHPCMKPYNESSDSEKELDRQYPKLFFQILKEHGYEIVKKEESK